MDAKAGEPVRNDKMTRSVDTLKELYTVAVGVALVMAVGKLADKDASAPVFGSDSFFLFLVMAATLIPFYHGAFRHMDDIYIFPEAPKKRPKPGVLLVDYMLLMLEAGLLVWLATSILSPAVFTKGFILLLAVDVLWAVVTGLLTPAKNVFKWGILNFVVAVILSGLCYWPGHTLIPAGCLCAVAVVRSTLDYWVSRRLYFPEA